VYSGDKLIGEARFLKPIFEASIRLLQQPLRFKGKQSKNLQIHNSSDIPYELELLTAADDLSVPAQISLPPRRTVLFQVRSESTTLSVEREAKPGYRIKNLLVAPGKGLELELPFTVQWSPE
jgi:hypothetical protein